MKPCTKKRSIGQTQSSRRSFLPCPNVYHATAKSLKAGQEIPILEKSTRKRPTYQHDRSLPSPLRLSLPCRNGERKSQLFIFKNPLRYFREANSDRTLTPPNSSRKRPCSEMLCSPSHCEIRRNNANRRNAIHERIHARHEIDEKT